MSRAEDKDPQKNGRASAHEPGQTAHDLRLQLQRAETARREMEFIINHSPVVVFLWRAAEGWPVEYVSENIRQFGYTPEDFCSGKLPFASLIHPDDLPRVAAEVEEYSRDPNCEQFQQEYRLRTGDGRYIWVDDRTWIRRDERGHITHYQGILLDVTDRKTAEDSLRESEERYRTLHEQASDAIFVHDMTGRIVDVNRRACEHLGYTRQELIGKHIGEIDPYAIQNGRDRLWPEILAGRRVTFESFHRAKDGRDIPVEISLGCVRLPRGPMIMGLVRDLTERRKAETRILQLNRLLHTISEINQLVMRAKNKQQLFDGACSILVQHGGFPAVWIGEIDRESARVRPVAWAGLEDDYMRSVDIRFDESPEGRGPAGRAVRTGQHVVVSDLREIRAGEPWSERLRQRGFLCAGAFPIHVRGVVMAVLNLGAHEARAIRVEEEEHLEELAADLGYALEVLDLRREQIQALERLKIREAQLSNALAIAKAGHWEYDVEKDLFTFNDNFYRIFHTTADKVGGYQMSSAEYARRFCHPDDAYMVAREVQAAIETKDPNYSRQLEHRILYADGGVGYIAVRFFIVKDASGRTVRTYGVNQDITEHKLIEERMAEQLRELRQWYNVTLGREERIMELKKEVDELLLRLGEKPRYGAKS